MIFFDINTFFGSKGGGIRTYHQAKIDYFLDHPTDSYFLVYPGAVHKVTHISENVTLVQVYGKMLTKDPEGYRLLLDYFKIYQLIKKVQPDVIEAGDPYLTGLFSFFVPFPKKTIQSTFFHSDSIDTYLRPWIIRHRIFGGKSISNGIERLFFYLHKKFDAVLVASHTIEKKLHQHGVNRTHYVPFANDPLMLEAYCKRKIEGGTGEIRLLYAARLDQEKSVDILLKIIPKLLQIPQIKLSVAGRGQYEDDFAKINHPKYCFLGYVSSRKELAKIFGRHHIFLATGQYETFGFATLEAMASGLVVVGPDKGETAERLQHCGSPFMYKAGDPNSFLENILAACKCDLVAEAQSANAFAREFGHWNESIDRMVKEYKRLFRERNKIVARV